MNVEIADKTPEVHDEVVSEAITAVIAMIYTFHMLHMYVHLYMLVSETCM